MKRILRSIIPGLLLYGASGGIAASENPQPVDGVAAVVGDEVILRSEVERAANPALARFAEENGGSIPLPLQQRIFREAVSSVIDTRLLAAAAQRMNLETTPEEIDQTIEQIARQEDVSVEELYGMVAAEGLSQEQYRQELSAQIIRMRVISVGVRSRITVSDEEILELFNERYGNRSGRYVRLRHILIPFPPTDDPETLERADQIAANVRRAAEEGEDFGRLAQKFSAAPSAAQGGIMELEEGTAVPELAEPAFTLAPGEISEVIVTRHGLNLIQVIERFDPADIDVEAVREALYQELLERETQPEVERFLKELRAERYVEIIAPEYR